MTSRRANERLPRTNATRPDSRARHPSERAADVHDRGHHRSDTRHFFTIPEVAEYVRVSTRTVRRWIGDGDLVVHRVGAVVRIAELDLRAFLSLYREG